MGVSVCGKVITCFQETLEENELYLCAPLFCPWQFLSHGYGIQEKGMDISRNYFTNEENMIKSYTTTLDKVSKQQEPLEKLVKLRIEWYVLRQSQPLVRTLVYSVFVSI